MLHLDDGFLAEVGLESLDPQAREPFLTHVYAELEHRVGTTLCAGLSDNQIVQFEAIIDRRMEVVEVWLEQHHPRYLEDPRFMEIVRNLPEADPEEWMCEFAATEWLAMHCPGYRSVVAVTLKKLKAEIARNREAILSA